MQKHITPDIVVLPTATGRRAVAVNADVTRSVPVRTAVQAAGSHGGTYIMGYPTTFSIPQGGVLHLHLSTDASSFYVDVGPVEMQAPDPPVHTSPPYLYSENVNGGNAFNLGQGPSGAGPGGNDWGWPGNYALTVHPDWKSGIYCIVLTTPSGASSFVPFVIRPQSPAADILYKFNLNTITAYNGVRSSPSLYSSFQPNAKPAGYKATLRRPIDTGTVALIGRYDVPMIEWLNAQGYGVEYCTDVDLEMDGARILSHYRLMMSVGHDEYWGEGMRAAVENFVLNGGNVAFLSGNTCFWRVHFTDNDTQAKVPTAIVCNKGAYNPDQLTSMTPDQIDLKCAAGPDSWWASPTYIDARQRYPFQNQTFTSQAATRSECALTGVATRFAGILRPNEGSVPPQGYAVQFPDHWIYNGVGVSDGAIFGSSTPIIDTTQDEHGNTISLPPEGIVGYEADGAPLTPSDDGSPRVPDPSYGTPPNFLVLGVALLDPVRWIHSDDPNAWQVPQNEGVSFDTLYTLYSQSGTVDLNAGNAGPGAMWAATMGSYSRYGTVFTAATVNWTRYMNLAPPSQSSDVATVQAITKNVLDVLARRAAPEPIARTLVGVAQNPSDQSPLFLFENFGTYEPVFWTTSFGPQLQRTGTGSIIINGRTLTNWHIVGVADFDADGSVYMMFQNSVTNGLFYMIVDVDLSLVLPAGNTASNFFDVVLDADWKIVGTPDIDLDGRSDVLLQNQSTGFLKYWHINAGGGTKTYEFETAVNPQDPGGKEWRVVGTPAIGAVPAGASSRMPAILFQNSATGALVYWQMTQFKSHSGSIQQGYNMSGHWVGVTPQGPSTTDWIVVSAPDLNDDGIPDILFQNKGTGQLMYWLMALNSAAGWHRVGAAVTVQPIP